MITIAIEAATYVGSVALLDDDTLLAERKVAMRGREHEALMPAVADVLVQAGLSPSSLGRIVCGAGPGAFTSLRIAGGIAKGLALSCGATLTPVSSLALIIAAQARPAGRYLAAIDAMRGEHYVQPFEVSDCGMVSSAGSVALVQTPALAAAGDAIEAMVIGPDQPSERRADPHARGVVRVTNLLSGMHVADLATWEPAYGRLAEAQVKWEAAHGRPLAVP